MLKDGRRGVLRREVADFLAAGLGLPGPPPGRTGRSNPGRIELAAAEMAAWAGARGGRRLDRWDVPRDGA